jgi:hypothetical protein
MITSILNEQPGSSLLLFLHLLLPHEPNPLILRHRQPAPGADIRLRPAVAGPPGTHEGFAGACLDWAEPTPHADRIRAGNAARMFSTRNVRGAPVVRQ